MTDPVRTAAADALEATTRTPSILVGFDGFLDSITSVVHTRRSVGPDDYEPMRTIDMLASRIAAASGGRSTNIELRERELRAGGNGPLLASALCAQGAAVTLIGALGVGEADAVHPAYEPLIGRCAEAVSIGPAARTDALEFDDGKVMFNWSANLDPIDWAFLVERLGTVRLLAMCARVDTIATINWTNLGGLPSIWRGLRDTILSKMDGPPGVFVDLSDPAKRSDDAVRGMLSDLRALSAVAPVTLGLNLAEARRIGSLTEGETTPASADPGVMRDAATRLRSALGLAVVLVHTRGMVAGADDSGDAAVPTALVERPVISTGAGDHFNGGYIAARTLGLDLAGALASGADTASLYVESGEAPSRARLIARLRESHAGSA